jgi:hypothetical protein
MFSQPVCLWAGAMSAPRKAFAAIILAAGFAYVISLAFGRHGGLVKTLLPQRHLEA